MSNSRTAGPTTAEPCATLLPCDSTAAGAARRLVVAECRSAGLDRVSADVAELLTSEVVTNAVIHGRSAVRLSVRASPCRVRVDVGDDNSRRPVLVRADAGALDGRGLAIVDLLASAWGVDDSGIGKAVWFEVTC
jgi:anti-sigma regulatory factor (Ser/Thr protein kinase)